MEPQDLLKAIISMQSEAAHALNKHMLNPDDPDGDIYLCLMTCLQISSKAMTDWYESTPLRLPDSATSEQK